MDGSEQEVEVHASGNALPVPNGNPLTGIHQTPDFPEDFGYTVRMA